MSNGGAPIVIWSPEPWLTGAPTNKHQLAKRFADQVDVLYVYAAGRSVRSGIRPLTSTVLDPSGVWVGEVIGLPERIRQRSELTRTLQDWIAAAAVRRIARARGWTTFRLLVYFPMSLGALRWLSPDMTLYHCVDHHASVPQWSANADALLRVESRLVSDADAVVATSSRLVAHCGQWRSDVTLLENVGDVELFSRAASTDRHRTRTTARPLGFFHGTFSSRKIDFAFLRAFIEGSPEFSWRLVGDAVDTQSRVALTDLAARANVEWSGALPQEEVVTALSGADILILPYARNPHTEHAFPLKLIEYLATGKPMVATRLETVADFCGDTIEYAGSGPEAAAAATALLSEPVGARERRRALARGRTWDARATELLTLLDAE